MHAARTAPIAELVSLHDAGGSRVVRSLTSQVAQKTPVPQTSPIHHPPMPPVRLGFRWWNLGGSNP